MTAPETCAGVQRPPPPVPRELSPQRRRGRVRVAQVIRGVVDQGLQRGAHYIARWAKALTLSESAVRQRCDVDHVDHAAWAAGDLWALGEAHPEDLEELLAALVADCEASAPVPSPRDPQALVLAATVRVGELARAAGVAMADGVCTADEWRDVERRFADLDREVRRGRAAARRAMGGGR